MDSYGIQQKLNDKKEVNNFKEINDKLDKIYESLKKMEEIGSKIHVELEKQGETLEAINQNMPGIIQKVNENTKTVKRIERGTVGCRIL